MNFCSDCGSKVSLQAVAGDNRQRFVCDDCGKTHYQNPKRPSWPTYVLRCRIHTLDQAWKLRLQLASGAMPGGYMENDETPEAGASRELREGKPALMCRPDDMLLVSVSSILHMAQTHLVFRCHLEHRPETVRTEEAVEFGWFDEDDLPWDNLAFASIEPHVRQVYRWLRKGNYGIRVGFIDENGSQYRNFPLAHDS